MGDQQKDDGVTSGIHSGLMHPSLLNLRQEPTVAGMARRGESFYRFHSTNGIA